MNERAAAGVIKIWIVVCALAAFVSACKTPPKEITSLASAAAPSLITPPALAIESFQAVWEIIRDTHFDTNFNGLAWNQVRADFLPRIQAAETDDELHHRPRPVRSLVRL